MSALNHFQENKMPSRRRSSRYLKLEESLEYAAPAKRRIADPVFGRKEASVDSLSLIVSHQIVELNNCGVAFYEKEDFAAADALFMEAALMRQQTVLNEAGRYLSHQVLQHLAIGTEDDSSLKKKNEPPSSSYIYQRMDFDEGMGNVYTKAERLCHEGDHPVAVEATLLFNIAQAKRMRQDYEGAWSFYQQALKVLIPLAVVPTTVGSIPLLACLTHSISVVQTVHRIVVPVLHNIGLLAYRQGNLMEAAAYYEIALTHGSAIIGSQSICVGITLNCLGVIHYHSTTSSNTASQEAAAPTVALQYLLRALQLLSASLGPDSPAVATTLNNLGRVMVQRDDFKAALVYYERALKIRREQLGSDNIDYAATAFNAGQSLHQLGDYDRAILLYKEFLRVASVKFSRNHRDGKAFVLLP
jgi:tetratricopeptide (TPR) repeat protein